MVIYIANSRFAELHSKRSVTAYVHLFTVCIMRDNNKFSEHVNDQKKEQFWGSCRPTDGNKNNNLLTKQ